MSAVPVLIALGSNLGDSPALVRSALLRLQALSIRPVRESSLWRSLPVDCPPDSPLFINAAAVLFPPLTATPESLLKQLQALEIEFGRRPKVRLNEPRPLDLDLILFGEERRATADLVLPHPRAHQRRFVLEPLNELVPDLVLPGQTRTVRQLLGELHSSEDVTRLPG